MITTNYYLDTRSAKDAAPLRIALTYRRQRSYITLPVKLHPDQWDAAARLVVNHPQKAALNNLITSQKIAVDSVVLRLQNEGRLVGLSITQIRDAVLAELTHEEVQRYTLADAFRASIAARHGRTRELYEITLKRLGDYCDVEHLAMDDVTPAWLTKFDAYLAQTAPKRNARNIHLRNIRAVFNDAVDDERTTAYPFRKFHIRPERTRKRALSVEMLRRLFDAGETPTERRYLDFLRLSFCLCGINVIDLCNAMPAVDGRVDYHRAKTHRLYSIKVEPEAAALIEQYAGRERLVNFAEGCQDYRFFYRRLSGVLRVVGKRLGIEGLSTYWARHSWATIAAALEIPKETIAAALGHGGHSVTDIYIDFDARKIDAANRAVLDAVFGGH